MEVIDYSNIRFADIQLLRYTVPAFDTLSLKRKLYIYHLAEAALCGRDILWDQNCRYNLAIRRLLEDILLHSSVSREGGEWEAFVTYLRRVWFANGIHHHYSTDKFRPDFSAGWLRTAYAGIASPVVGEDVFEELLTVITDSTVLPKRVCQDAEDLLLASACNYYADGITQAEAEQFYRDLKATAPDADRPVMYGMNSRLERAEDGTLRENIYSTSGLYATCLQRICGHLREAEEYAENDRQRDIIGRLLEFYRTGSLDTFDRYTIAWIGETEGEVDFVNGFTEVYGDPLGLKASWEGYVNITRTRRPRTGRKCCARMRNGLRTTVPWTGASRRKSAGE